MDEAIKEEQKKLAEKLRGMTKEEMERQGVNILCWLQGYDVGFQSAKEGVKNE